MYPAASASEAASASDQALEALQAVMTQPLPDRTKATPSKRKGSAHGMMVVVCDEMDQLMSSAQEVLYDLFFLPQVLLYPAVLCSPGLVLAYLLGQGSVRLFHSSLTFCLITLCCKAKDATVCF